MIRTLKYNDVKQRLIRYIFENRMKEGDKLPSEQKLCALFETSNLPLRRAEDELCNGGMLRREKNRGVFVGNGWDRTSFTSRLGILSIGVDDYPSGEQETTFRKALRAHHCDLRVIRTFGRDVNNLAIGELEQCDYIVISGFVTQAWVEAVKALEKPILHIGYTELDTGIPRVENDFPDLFQKIFQVADKVEAKRMLVWLPLREEVSYADSMIDGMDEAIARCGIDEARIIRDYVSIYSIRGCIKSLRRYRDDYDMLVLRDYVLDSLGCYREWGELLGDRPLMVISTRRLLPNDFDMLRNTYRIRIPQRSLEIAEKFFFSWNNRLPDGEGVLKLKAELSHKFDGGDYWEN